MRPAIFAAVIFASAATIIGLSIAEHNSVQAKTAAARAEIRAADERERQHAHEVAVADYESHETENDRELKRLTEEDLAAARQPR